jgi:hypothetical protein
MRARRTVNGWGGIGKPTHGPSKLIQVIFSIALTLAGLVLILLTPQTIKPTPLDTLLYNLGLSATVAGVISLFQVLALKSSQDRETADQVTGQLEAYLRERPFDAKGLRFIAPRRQGISEYYGWCVADHPGEMIFAGRSVLHRIDKDLASREVAGSATAALTRSLLRGAQVTIMFVDPRSNLISRIASEEGQTELELLTDLQASVTICHRLYETVSKINLPVSARLDIMIYDAIPYFAYHRVGEDAIVGFYFSSIRGDQQAAYEIIDPKLREFFEHHYLSIRSGRARTDLLSINPHRSQLILHHEVFDSLRACFRSRSIDAGF